MSLITLFVIGTIITVGGLWLATRESPKPEMHAQKLYLVTAKWDAEAGVWVASSDDVQGLATESESFDSLQTKLRTMVPELLMLNGQIQPGTVVQTMLLKAET